MHMTFWYAEKGYETALGPALIEGAAAHGDTVAMRPLEEYRSPPPGGSIVCGIVKREILWEHQAAGIPILYLDKGYHRNRLPWRGRNIPGWWRLCWNAAHPTIYLMDVARSADRWKKLGVALAPRRRGNKIVILGSSAKFHLAERLPHPTSWAQAVVDVVSRISPSQIIYRPKPSWSDAEPIRGAVFDHGSKTLVTSAFDDACCSITYGSIAAVDSIIAGIPCIVLGNAVARPICSTALPAVLDPLWESEARREQWAANLAYCHFTPDEIARGRAWKILKEIARYAV